MRLSRLVSPLLATALCLALVPRALAALPRLKVNDNKRFLVYEDGRPFFYLGDTAIGEFPNTGEREFVSPDPGEQLDWVLVLDDAAKSFPQPGTSIDSKK